MSELAYWLITASLCSIAVCGWLSYLEAHKKQIRAWFKKW